MDQYYKLFGTCKIPKINKDVINVMQIFNADVKRNNHITIMYRNKV